MLIDYTLRLNGLWFVICEVYLYYMMIDFGFDLLDLILYIFIHLFANKSLRNVWLLFILMLLDDHSFGYLILCVIDQIHV